VILLAVAYQGARKTDVFPGLQNLGVPKIIDVLLNCTQIITDTMSLKYY